MDSLVDFPPLVLRCSSGRAVLGEEAVPESPPSTNVPRRCYLSMLPYFLRGQLPVEEFSEMRIIEEDQGPVALQREVCILHPMVVKSNQEYLTTSNSLVQLRNPRSKGTHDAYGSGDAVRSRDTGAALLFAELPPKRLLPYFEIAALTFQNRHAGTHRRILEE